MPTSGRVRLATLLIGAMASAAGWAARPAPSPSSPDFDGGNWASVGRTAGETRYSPLTEINRETVTRLKLAWTLDLDVGSAQSTPLAVDGVLYVAAGYSVVHAVDARNGKLLWRFDPEAAKVAGKKLRAGSGTRGLAYSNGRLFVGTHDGRLIALDAKKGTPIWSTPTLDPNDGSFIDGAPRVFNDKVAIGFGDSGTVHGAVGVYDALGGKQLWRWETQGGGGAIWNAMAYDPEANRLYVGTGNARGADAAANHFACSVVALNADTGQLAWQYDAAADHTQCDDSLDITLATINIDGQPRNVILHAPKDGSMQVIDRLTGKLISSKKLGVGAHTHFAQSFSPATGLVYLPTSEIPAENPEGDAPADAGKSALLAWDPVKQRAAWAQPTAGAFSGGVLSTAGDLVFQGQADGYITAYSAAEGRRVWAFFSATAALGAPISFAIGKRQYISILNGPPQGTPASLGVMSARFGWDSRAHPRRLLTFVLDGTGTLPPTPGPTPAKPLDAPEIIVDEALAKEGALAYAKCRWCHGAGAIAGGGAPDLRASPMVLNTGPFTTLVRGGLETRGMPKFDELGDRELEALRNYIRARARLVTRPDGVAPVVPAVVEPAPAAPEEPSQPSKPAGSLESEPPPHKL
ncbi:MAG TPA: PQQ-binding-like beta-propeller repeat protein [Steroidobacteraceae bacterium]|jgi:quinohemoprotein ethanol dehydrogenase|nr:PQQ-binding-like beta-propeller repeat protein [Steroidobacteraceae bacterium]